MILKYSNITGLITAMLLTLAFTVPAHAELSMGDALNKAGRQRMLSQRIVKAYALVGQDLMISAIVQLDDAITLFEQQLTELTEFSTTAEEKKSISLVDTLWQSYKQLAQTKPTQDNAVKLNALSEEVLSEAHNYVLLLEKRSASHAGHLVNISGRQRMLSQRIAKFYVLQSWNLKDQAYPKGYSKAVKEFSSALKELKVATENTAEINNILSKVQKLWNSYRISNRVRGGKYIPSLVVRQLDKILVQMNDITALYAAIYK